MGVRPGNISDAAFSQVSQFFESQLLTIGLGESQIAEQDIVELEDSLGRVNDALRSPDSFGFLRVSITAEATPIIVLKRSDAHIEIGILPILLDRKRKILDRLRLLRSQRPILDLAQLVDSVADANLREQLRMELEAAKVPYVSANSPKIESGSAFIAMAMNPNDPLLEDVLDAIKDAAHSCGIVAERIDESISNEPITKRMLSAIETSEFVVVDLTHVRPNVFYEAGYAQGLGKTPIYLARNGSELPFDLKDYPVILYSNMRELRRKLAERLNAVRTGRGLPASARDQN